MSTKRVAKGVDAPPVVTVGAKPKAKPRAQAKPPAASRAVDKVKAEKPAPKSEPALAKARRGAPVDKSKSKGDELSAMEERFCEEFLIDLNGTQAYLRSKPGVKETTARTEASRLLAKPNIAERIVALKAERAARVGIDADRVLREVYTIAHADMRELVEYHVTCCRCCYGRDFGHQRTRQEMARDRAEHDKQQQKARAKAEAQGKMFEPEDFDEQGGEGYDGRRPPNPNCEVCWGKGVGEAIVKDTRYFSQAAQALYAGVKITKEGLEIKAHSKDAAQDKLFRHLGLYEADNAQKSDTKIVSKDELDDLYRQSQEHAEQQRSAMAERRQRLDAEAAQKGEAGGGGSG